MQHSVNIIIEAAVSDPAESFIPPRASQPNGNGHDPSINGGGLSKTLDVEEKKFFVVKATAESIGLLRDYLGVVVNLEIVVTDVMGRIIEFLKVSHLTTGDSIFRLQGSLSTLGLVKLYSVQELCDQQDSKISQRSILVSYGVLSTVRSRDLSSHGQPWHRNLFR